MRRELFNLFSKQLLAVAKRLYIKSFLLETLNSKKNYFNFTCVTLSDSQSRKNYDEKEYI